MEILDEVLGQGAMSGDEAPEEGATTSQPNMETLLQEEGLALDFPTPGEIRSGTIASISSGQILVSVGAKSEGIITGRELESIPTEEREALEVGQEIPVYVMGSDDANGIITLSYSRAVEQQGWEEVEKMLEAEDAYESAVEGYNKGGLIVLVHGLRGFVPASQIGMMRRMQVTGDTPDQRYGKLVGEPITVRVIEVDRNRRRLILSERAASVETRQSIKEKVIDELQEGEVYAGRVSSLADFGAFVNVNGADGLVHLSEISWERIQHPSEVLEVGQEVKVKVINIDREKKRIGLSIRSLENDPWKKRIEKFKTGQLVEGIITRLTKFGAFARIEGDLEGLIHISEISESRIEHPKEKLHDGDVVTLRIIRIEPEQRRIGLSLRKVDSGAYKDLDMKGIDLEGIDLEDLQQSLAEDEPADSPIEEILDEVIEKAEPVDEEILDEVTEKAEPAKAEPADEEALDEASDLDSPATEETK